MMISHLEETKAALKDKGLRVFTEETIFQVGRQAGMTLTRDQRPSSVLKALGFKTAAIQSPYRKLNLYYWPDATIYEIGQALNPRAYLCQLAALGFHGLASEPLQHLVVNEEQSAKPQSQSRFSQSAIDNAFKGAPRVTNNVGVWNSRGRETFFYLTNSKHTKQAGVVPAACGPATIRVTTVARTLLDCAVRAFYSGEPAVIVEGYRRACEKHDVPDLLNEIIQLLTQVGHKYPYHQAIGYYFESACPHLPPQTWQPLRELGIKFQFYLTYRMKEPLFDEKWQIYYPRDLGLV